MRSPGNALPVAISPSEAFGRALRELRAERELSQEEAALSSDLDRTYFGDIERAAKSPTLKTVWKIAEGFEVPPSNLLVRTEEILEKAPSPASASAKRS